MANDYQKRLRELAGLDKGTSKSTNINASTLIDYKRAADGTALGIIKENHNYYLKTSTTQGESLSVADFAYIGGIENKRKFQYESVAKADKHRESYLGNISEALTFRDAKELPKKNLNESKQLPTLTPDTNADSFIKNTIASGKKSINEGYEQRFKESLKPTQTTDAKKGLLPEAADLAIKKALGLIKEAKDLSTADSEIKDSDMVADKKGGKGKPQAPVNDSNAKTKANLGHAQPSDLVTSDSEATESEHIANKKGKEKPQAPINDSNAKSKADAAKATSHQVHSKTKVSESTALVTADSEEKESDFIANKTGKEKPQAPINDSNAKTKANHGVSQPSDLVTSDSEEKESDFIADKTGHETPDAPVNMYNQPEWADKNKATAKPSEEEMKKAVNDKGKKVTTNDIVAEGKKKSKVVEGVSIVDADSQQGTAMPDESSNVSFGVGELEPGTSFAMDDDAISEDAPADVELDAAAKALQDLEMSDASDSAPADAVSAPVDTEPAPVPSADIAPDADPTAAAPAPTPDATTAPESPEGGSLDDIGLGAPVDGAADGGEGESIDAGVPAEGGEESPEDVDAAAAEVTGGEDGGDNTEEGFNKEIDKLIGKLTYQVRQTELAPEKTEASLNSILAGFKEDLKNVDLEKRKEMATKLVKLNFGEEGDGEESTDELPSEEPALDDAGADVSAEEPALDMDKNEAIDGQIASLKEAGINDEDDDDSEEEVEVTDDGDSEEIDTKDEEPVGDDVEDDTTSDDGAEEGGFNSYMKDRGYDPASAGSSSEDEIGSVVSGWANDHGDDESQYKTVAIYLTPAIQKHLEDIGHGEFLQKLLPVLAGMGEDQMVKFGGVEPMPDAETDSDVEASDSTPDMSFASPQTLGAGIAKLSGGTETASANDSEEETASEEPTASNVTSDDVATDDAESDEEKPETEEMSESSKKLRDYIQKKLDEKTGKRKAVLKEGQKSATAILVERIIDEEINRLKKKLSENHKMTAQEINEVSLSGLLNVGQTVGNMAKGVVDNVVTAVETKINNATAAVKNAGDTLVKSYHAGAKNAVLDDIQKMAVELGQLIAKVNASAVKAGEQPINSKSILATIQNQLTAKQPQPVNLGKFKTPAGGKKAPVAPAAPAPAPTAKKPVVSKTPKP